MKKQTTITKQTKNKLTKSFWKIYKKNNLSKITVKDICDHAKVDRTTFYRYFNDIADILNKLEIKPA